jgi:hypothetical protein
MEEKVKEQDVLLVRKKESSELFTAKMENDGTVSGVKPDKNPDFLRIDRHGNVLENFFENFKRQVKDPTRFEFFRVPLEKLQEVFNSLQEALKEPNTPENKEYIDMHRINPDDFMKKQGQGQTSEKEYAIDPELVEWDKLEKFGLTRATLEKTGDLEKILDYRKTDLLPVSIKMDDETTLHTDARFSLRKQEDGSFSPNVHLIRHKPELERPYFGVKFTEEDRQNLLQSGNLGRMIEAEFRQGEKTPVLLSLDRLTNELVAFRSELIRIPENIKGVRLNEEQKRDLAEGKAVYIEKMISKTGKEFSASLQFNADKRGFEFLFDKENRQSHTRDNTQKDIQKTFRGKELSEEQRESLGEGKTVYVDGLTDKKGKGYSGYITVDKETGRTDFMFAKDYKAALAEGRVIPDDRHKTQAAAGSKSKTNETAKNGKESLDKGEKQPAEKQEAKQAVKKFKGLKM